MNSSNLQYFVGAVVISVSVCFFNSSKIEKERVRASERDRREREIERVADWEMGNGFRCSYFGL